LFSKAKEAPAATPALAEDPLVAQARTQARRRLVGAVVLLAIGVIAFPLVFDTQPRPMPQEWRVVGASGAATGNALPKPIVGTPGARNGGRELTPATLPEDAGIESGRAASAPSPPATPSPAPSPASSPAAAASKPVPPAPKPEPAPAAEPVPKPPSVAPATGQRFVVQAGAYTDAGSLRTARQKVEGLGLKTYTQDIENAQGKRTRVRVGPFVTREEAEAAARRIKATGLQASVLAL
jgi:DedD protein